MLFLDKDPSLESKGYNTTDRSIFSYRIFIALSVSIIMSLPKDSEASNAICDKSGLTSWTLLRDIKRGMKSYSSLSFKSSYHDLEAKAFSG
jgi:hypothetical protein